MSDRAVVIGAGPDGLVAAIAMARSGSKVTVLEAGPEPGGLLREIEFAPGFRAAPFATDPGWLSPEVLRGVGLARQPLDESRPDPCLVAPLDDGLLELGPDVGATATRIRRFAPRDAERWSDFTGRMHRLAGALAPLYLAPAPRIDARGIGELAGLARLGHKVRGLGRVEMIEFLRIVPMAVAELLDEWFGAEPLKALLASTALSDLCFGPRAGATAFGFLHHHVGQPAGTFGPRGLLAAGPRALVEVLLEQARGAGVEIRTGAAVREILVEGERATGVGLDSGEQVRAAEVISTLDPKRTMLELVDPVHLDPETIDAFRHLRLRPARTTVLLALERLPELPGSGDGRALGGSYRIAPSLDYLERAADATKYGQTAPEPWLDVRVPTLTTPALAPGDQHVMVIQVQCTPYALRDTSWESERDRVADRAVAIAARSLPGLAERILHRKVIAPPDAEQMLGVSEGAPTHGELMLDQILFSRPVAGWSRYAMPVPGVYLGGPGAHPGPGITGAAGWLAAQHALKGRGR
ncbi:MAG: NAD(P)/FAD-dependent oxidoreductase [Gemmatimonadales bacterium]